ncbi:MAG: HEAT repeat domain-containing protein [Sphingobacteriales bacterium]|nr:MAG: HEAT repeat domain-containing protein [Sphingobacteriales bacterium]
MIVMIYVHLYRKKRRYFNRQYIESILDEWIGAAIIEPSVEGWHVHVTPELLDEFEKEHNRQIAIDQLINTKKNLLGEASENIVRLYMQLNLQRDSYKKMKSLIWHKKAKGIYELYMMGQEDIQDEIFKYTNSQNEYVRMEAQTAIIGFQGFKGLTFLGPLTESLVDWQQIKLIEQLKPLDPDLNAAQLSSWLHSSNDYVIVFALKLAEIYQQFYAHDIAAQKLSSSNDRVRRQAILTLANIAGDHTAALLVAQYAKETPQNKKVILQNLTSIATDNELPFLLQELENEDDQVKLDVSRVLYKGYSSGSELLAQKAQQSPAPYEAILKHVKSEVV